MKNQYMTINEFKNPNGSYKIVINNIRLHNEMQKQIYFIIEQFATGPELFFGHYKKDGVYLSNEEMEKYSIEIPEFFNSFGTYHQIEQTCKKNKKIERIYNDLIVCRAPNNIKLYKMLNKIFDYYLETVFFCPKVKWDAFVDSYANYMHNVTDDYVLNGYADFLFAYVDSGDFSISFDPRKHDPVAVRNQINLLLF